MKEFITKNIALVFAFLLPVILILIVALSTYLPSFFLSTHYNFIYAACFDGRSYYGDYGCGNYLQQRYSVTNNRLTLSYVNPSQDSDRDGVPDVNENYPIRIFLHDTEKNESREITLQEAQTLTLSGAITSPDGVTVQYGYGSSGDFFFIFGGGSSPGYFLTKGNSKTRLNLIFGDRYYYDNSFHFLGWVLPGRS